MTTLALLIFSAALFAQNKPTEAKPPAIPADLETEYFRADGVLAHLAPTVQEAQADMQKAVSAVQKACGEKFGPSLVDKHLVCVAKPEPPKK